MPTEITSSSDCRRAAPHGATKTYTVTVTRLALSNDATLSELELTDVTLDPVFDRE